MGSFLPIGVRLREQREGLGMNQTDFASAAGVSRKTLFGYETGERSPDAAALAAWGKLGLDILYVVTGEPIASPLAAGVAAVSGRQPHIEVARLARICGMLEEVALKARKRWPAQKLATVSAEVYNALIEDRDFDESRVDRILKLVVNR